MALHEMHDHGATNNSYKFNNKSKIKSDQLNAPSGVRAFAALNLTLMQLELQTLGRQWYHYLDFPYLSCYLIRPGRVWPIMTSEPEYVLLFGCVCSDMLQH